MGPLYQRWAFTKQPWLLPATQFVNHQLEVVHLQPVLYGSAGLDLERKAGVDITRHGLKNLKIYEVYPDSEPRQYLFYDSSKKI